MKLAAILAAVRAALTVAKASFTKLGWSKAEQAASVALTLDEAAQVVAAHGASGSAVVFLQAVDMAAPTFGRYLKDLGGALKRHADATGEKLPTVIPLPPGVTVQVIEEKAAQMEAAAKAILSGAKQ